MAGSNPQISRAKVAGFPCSLPVVSSARNQKREMKDGPGFLALLLFSAGEIIKLKGYTSWAIGLSCAAILSAILRNTRNVFALSTDVKVCFICHNFKPELKDLFLYFRFFFGTVEETMLIAVRKNQNI